MNLQSNVQKSSLCSKRLCFLLLGERSSIYFFNNHKTDMFIRFMSWILEILLASRNIHTPQLHKSFLWTLILNIILHSDLPIYFCINSSRESVTNFENFRAKKLISVFEICYSNLGWQLLTFCRKTSHFFLVPFQIKKMSSIYLK